MALLLFSTGSNISCTDAPSIALSSALVNIYLIQTKARPTPWILLIPIMKDSSSRYGITDRAYESSRVKQIYERHGQALGLLRFISLRQFQYLLAILQHVVLHKLLGETFRLSEILSTQRKGLGGWVSLQDIAQFSEFL